MTIRAFTQFASILATPITLQLQHRAGGVWKSLDSGLTWNLIGQGQSADFLPPELAADPNQQDPYRIVVCKAAPDVIWMQNHCGVQRSVDAALSRSIRR